MRVRETKKGGLGLGLENDTFINESVLFLGVLRILCSS